jgi:hypothetical protein
MEEVGLEGERAEDAPHAPAQGLQPFLSPGPELRRDEVEDGDVHGVGGLGQRQVEVRAVHHDDRVRAVMLPCLGDFPVQPEQSGQPEEDVEETREAESAHGETQVSARTGEHGAAHAADMQGRVLAQQLLGQRPGVHVAGRLAAVDPDLTHGPCPLLPA